MKYAVFIAILLLAACAQTNTTTQDEIVLGASLPLTGEAASWGAPAQGSMQAVIDEVNANGGINGRQVRLVVEDDKCAKDGITALTKLSVVDKVDAIIGPICSAAAGPGLPVVQENGIPSIIIASAPDLTLVGDYIFRVYPSDSFAGKFLAEYVYDQGLTSAAVIYTQNDWGRGIRDNFVTHYEELGGTVLVDEGMTQDQRDARTIITKIQARNPDIIVSPTYPGNGAIFVRQARELGLDQMIIGGDSWSTQEYTDEQAADGTYYITADIGTSEELKAHLANYMEDTDHIVVPLFYDATKIMLDVMQDVGTEPQAVRDALASGKWSGVSNPTIEFDENGDLVAASYVVNIVENGETRVIE